MKCSVSLAICPNSNTLTEAPADAPDIPAAWEAPVSSAGE